MSKRIAMFNHKGGVSKTTTTFNVGWMMASKGYKVVLVDTDPQCNLTGLVLGYKGTDDFENFYSNFPDQNIRSGLTPAFESQPKPIQAIEPVIVEGVSNLFLIPGHINLSEYEVTLGIAQELSSSIQALQNLPGSISYFLDKISEKLCADYIIIDMNPSLGSMNQNILMTSNYFIIPTAPDYFSRMAIDSLSTVLPRWLNWSEKAQNLPILEKAAYPFPKGKPKFLGTIIQKYRPRKGQPTEGFQKWIDQINKLVAKVLVPLLKDKGMTLEDATYDRIGNGYKDSYCLAQIPDFNTLIATSQSHNTPVFALTDDMFGHTGVVLDQDRQKRNDFNKTFSELADKIIRLTNE